MSKNIVRVIVPDSHGSEIDIRARDAFLKDLKLLDPTEMVWLGDHMNVGGVFNAHARNYTDELSESYEEDADATNQFLDMALARAPRCHALDYLEGNHEGHVERFAAQTFNLRKDAEGFLEKYGPEKVLDLKRRGFKYRRRAVQYQGLSIPGTIRLGECFFTHGISSAENCAQVHVKRFGFNVVFGHVHTAQSYVTRTVMSDGHGGWSPGCLAKLQPLWKHTDPTRWNHGYAVQFVAKSGRFLHINVPIYKGESFLMSVAKALA